MSSGNGIGSAIAQRDDDVGRNLRGFDVQINDSARHMLREGRRIFRFATLLPSMVAKQKGDFYHDGRFATLMEVVYHYDRHQNLSLTGDEKERLVLFVRSL